MREELLGPEVKDVAVAIVQQLDENKEKVYYAYLLNLKKDVIIEGIIITSKGYGKLPNSEEEVKTSTLRHTIELLLPNEAGKIEPIMEDVFSLNNEYWVSFYIDGRMHDKKYVFEAGIINESNFVEIPYLKARGIIIN